MNKIVSVLITCVLVIALAGCGGNGHEGEAKTPSGSIIQKGRGYQEVVNDFKEKGFKNIKTEKLEDLITGWLTNDGEVESVSVDGDKDYSPDVWYSNNVKVVITYHTFPSDDEKTETTSSLTNKENHDEAAKAALEASFPVEKAKRAVVVAITNSYAADVFKADGNTYDVSKFHSYADTSGKVESYFFNVTSWGTWSVKDEKAWHVDSLILKNIFGTVANGSLDVKYDGNNYIVSNVKGTFGTDGDLSEIENTKNASLFLSIPPKLIKNDRKLTE